MNFQDEAELNTFVSNLVSQRARVDDIVGPLLNERIPLKYIVAALVNQDFDIDDILPKIPSDILVASGGINVDTKKGRIQISQSELNDRYLLPQVPFLGPEIPTDEEYVPTDDEEDSEYVSLEGRFATASVGGGEVLPQGSTSEKWYDALRFISRQVIYGEEPREFRKQILGNPKDTKTVLKEDSQFRAEIFIVHDQIDKSFGHIVLTLRQKVSLPSEEGEDGAFPYMRLFAPVYPEEIGLDNGMDNKRCQQWFWCLYGDPIRTGRIQISKKESHPDEHVFHDKGWYVLNLVGRFGRDGLDKTGRVISWLCAVMKNWSREGYDQPEPSKCISATFLSLRSIDLVADLNPTLSKMFDRVLRYEDKIVMPRKIQSTGFIFWAPLRYGEEFVRSIPIDLGFEGVVVIEKDYTKIPSMGVYEVSRNEHVDRMDNLIPYNPHGRDTIRPHRILDRVPNAMVYLNEDHAACLVRNGEITLHAFDPWKKIHRIADELDDRRFREFLEAKNISIVPDELYFPIQGNEGSCVIHAIFMSVLAEMMRSGKNFSLDEFKEQISNIGGEGGELATIAACMVGYLFVLGGYSANADISTYSARLGGMQDVLTFSNALNNQKILADFITYYDGELPVKTDAGLILLPVILRTWKKYDPTGYNRRLTNELKSRGEIVESDELPVLIEMLEEGYKQDLVLLDALRTVREWTPDGVDKALADYYGPGFRHWLNSEGDELLESNMTDDDIVDHHGLWAILKYG